MALGTGKLRAILLGLSAVILLLLSWQHGSRLFHSLDIIMIDSVEAPDRSAVLDHCSSRTDTRPDHHAPYGDHVFFRKSRFSANDCSGTLIFAGYCQVLTMSWTKEAGIELECTGAGKVNTLTSIVGGTRVTLQKRPDEAGGNIRNNGGAETVQPTPR